MAVLVASLRPRRGMAARFGHVLASKWLFQGVTGVTGVSDSFGSLDFSLTFTSSGCLAPIAGLPQI